MTEPSPKKQRTSEDAAVGQSGLVAPPPPEPTVKYLAIDIERVGKEFRRGILQIGACFGSADGTIIEQVSFCSKVPPVDQFEPRCWLTFWSKYPEVLARIDAAAMPDHIAVFRDWVIGLEKKYGPFGCVHKEEAEAGIKRNLLRLLSDNPAYDIGMINLEFFKLSADYSPMAEMFAGYVPTDDPTEQERGLTDAQKKIVESFITAPHDHWATNDATQIFQRRCGLAAVFGD